MTARSTSDREIATGLSRLSATLDPAEWDLQHIARAALAQWGRGSIGNPARSQNSGDPAQPDRPVP